MDFIKFLPYYLKDEDSAVALFAALQDLMQDNADDFYTIIRDLLVWNVDNNSDQVNRALAQMLGLYGYPKLQAAVQETFLKEAKKITGKIGTPWSAIKMAEGCLDQAKIVGGVTGWIQEGAGGARYNSQYDYDSTIDYDSEFNQNKYNIYIPYVGGETAVSSTEDDNAAAVAQYYCREKNELNEIYYPHLETGLLSSLEGYYQLFEQYYAATIKDSSGNDRDGFLYNALAAHLNNIGPSLEFGNLFNFGNDANAVVFVDDFNDSNFIGTGAFSIFGVFFWPSSFMPGGFEYLCTLSGGGGQVSIKVDSSCLYFEIDDGVHTASNCQSSNLSSGWHSFMATYDYTSGDGNGMVLYIDGSSDVASDVINDIEDFQADDLFIGATDTSGSDASSFKMGCFRFYSDEATAAQTNTIDSRLL